MNHPAFASRPQTSWFSRRLGNLRLIIIALVILSMGFAAFGGVILYGTMRKQLLAESHRKAMALVEDTAQHFEAFISSNLTATATMAGTKRLRLVLTEPGPVTLKEANDALDLYRSSLKAEVCYFMDRTGLVVASSNRDQPDSFVGKNYAFRPYFHQAMLGRETIYPALGVTSGRRGVYFSRPVRAEDGRSIGVVVIKASVEEFVAYFSQAEEGVFVLTGPHDIVFMSNRRDWVYKLLWKPEAEVLEELTRGKQFGDGPWTWLGLVRESHHEARGAQGQRYTMHGQELKLLPGWRMVYFHDHRAMVAVLRHPLGLLSWSIAGFCLLVIFIAIIFLVWGSREIKARMLLEDVLRAQRQDLEQAQRIAHAGSWSYDPRTGRPTWSEEMFRIFGLDPGGEVPSYEEHRRFIHPDDWEGFDAAVRSAAAGGEGYALELKIVRPDGKIRHIFARGETTRGNDGAVTGLVGTALDITERVEMEKEQARLITELRDALSRIKTLDGLLPICAYCKKIRDDQGYWQQVEIYVRDRTTAGFTHGICPDCAKKFFSGANPKT